MRWQVATGCGGTGVSDTKADTWWWPVRASEVVGMRGSRRQLERGPESCGLCRTSAEEMHPLSPLKSRALHHQADKPTAFAQPDKAAEPTDQIGAIYSIHSPVKCSNKNLWTLASCFNFFLSKKKKCRKSVRCPMMELRGLKKKKKKRKKRKS